MVSFEKASDIDPNFLQAQKNLAEICIESGEFDKGVQTYKQILNNHPHDIETLLSVADLYSAIGDLESTKFVLNRVLEIDSNNETAKEGLAKIS